MPPQELHNSFASLLQELPQPLDSLARQLKAFTRARKIKSVAELFRLVLLYSFADMSVREIAALCVGSGKRLTDEAVRLRLAACADWLSALLAKLLLSTNLPQPVDGLRRLIICDGSHISCPGAKGTDYRWHISYDPVAQQICQLQLTDSHTSESLSRFAFTAGDLVLADRQFARAPAMVATRNSGAHLLVRMTTSYLKLWTLKHQPFDLLAALRSAGEQEQVSFALAVDDSQSGNWLPVWLHAHHLNEQQINRARRRVKRKASRNSHKPRKQTLYFNEWVIVLTTIGPEELSGAMILQLYLVRWQIELVIKRYKSLLRAANVRAKAGSALAEVYLRGKLIFAVMIERRAIKRVGTEWTQMHNARRGTWWRVWKLIAREMIEAVMNTAGWSGWDWQAVLRSLGERKRKRELQVIPEAVSQWLKTPRLSGWREAA